jgi:hypothetical protein
MRVNTCCVFANNGIAFTYETEIILGHFISKTCGPSVVGACVWNVAIEVNNKNRGRKKVHEETDMNTIHASGRPVIQNRKRTGTKSGVYGKMYLN